MGDLLETLKDGILTLTLNRPEARNGLNPALGLALTHATRRAAEDPKVRCVVLTGAGNTFCAGGDINAFPSSGGEDAPPSEPERSQVQNLRLYVEAAGLLHGMPKPTLAVINGAAAGAGLALALACDMRICLDTAKLTTAFSNIGASGDCGGSYFLPRVVGPAKARELYFTADVLTGKQALEIGMVTKIATAEELGDEANALAKYLASRPTVAIGLIKKNLNATNDATMSDVFDLEAANMALSLQTSDHKNALQAFLNKKPFQFEGR